jgi:uncharacterized protein YndB with AHSA1/START domain
MAYHWTLHIDAPPEKVFDTLADVEHHPEWANPKAKLSMTSVSGGPPALGSKYRSEQVFAGKAQTADIEIVRFDRPSRFAFAISQRKQGGSGKEVHYTHTFVLTPEDGGTKLERTTDGDGNKLVGFLAKPAIMKDGRTSLGNLKAKVEASN